MAEQLNRVLQRLVQRTSGNSSQLLTASDRAAFVNSVKADLASILEQLNSVYYPLAKTLMSTENINALDFGLSGNVVKTHILADSASATAFWDSTSSRPKTIKETVDALLAEIARLEGLIDELSYTLAYDDTALETRISDTELNLEQLTKDTMGNNYSLDADGLNNLTYSLSQILDAMGTLFTGYVSTGNVYDTSYPELSLNIPEIESIKTFIGMTTNETPVYSDYGIISIVADGDSLEESIQKLDLAVTEANLQATYDKGSAGLAGLIDLTPEMGEIQFNGAVDQTRIFSAALNGTDLFLVQNNLVAVYGVGFALPTLDFVPEIVALTGQLFGYSDFATGVNITEQAYADDVGNIAIITRAGRVREYEMGCTYIYAQNMVPAATPPTLQTVALGAAPGSDVIYQALVFPGTGNATTAYIHVSPPIDDQGEHPSAAIAEIFAVPLTNPGAASGVQFAFKFDHHDPSGSGFSGNTSFMIDGDSLVPTWDSQPYYVFNSFDVPGDLNKLFTHTRTIEIDDIGSSPCFIPIKIQRNPADTDDTYTGDVGIISIRITWYRHLI